jgi:hypothetical protein
MFQELHHQVLWLFVDRCWLRLREVDLGGVEGTELAEAAGQPQVQGFDNSAARHTSEVAALEEGL